MSTYMYPCQVKAHWCYNIVNTICYNSSLHVKNCLSLLGLYSCEDHLVIGRHVVGTISQVGVIDVVLVSNCVMDNP